jgi:hypothetical protein
MTHWFLTIATAVGKPRDNQLWEQLLKDLWQELLHLLRFSVVRLAKSSLEHDLRFVCEIGRSESWEVAQVD